MSETVNISRLVPHPSNSNRMSSDYFAKLTANIRETGVYPAIIVRNLSKSAKYGPGTPYFERAGGEHALQILDGYHRWKALTDLGHAQVQVDDWGAVDDTRALLLLATLNRLRGRDDTAKRATLLSMLRRDMTSDEVLSQYIPEDAEAIFKKCAASNEYREEPADLEFMSETLEPYTIMLEDGWKRVIEAAVKLRRSQGNLPGRDLDPKEYMTILSMYEVGRALVAICGDFVLKGTHER